VPIGELRPNERNPNTHPASQIALLAKIIQRQGWRAPIVVSRRSGFVVVGHGRLAAARLLGCEVVPVNDQDFATEADEWAHMLADNRLAELAETDEKALAELLGELSGANFEMDLTGFDAGEVGKILDSITGNADAEPQMDRAAELNKKWQVKSGDMWRIGDHLLMCGDAAEKDDVNLAEANTADLFLCDPPFQMEADKQASILNGLKARQILWLSGTPSVYEVWRHCTRKDYRWTLFWEGGASMSVPNEHRPNISCDVFLAFGSDGLFRKSQAISRMKLQTDCIPHCIRIGRDFTTWRLTPLMKPLLLFEGMIELLSEPGSVVSDLFLSSGTTMVACENLKRKCRGIEISPDYCAVILQRMQDTFPSIKIERL